MDIPLRKLHPAALHKVLAVISPRKVMPKGTVPRSPALGHSPAILLEWAAVLVTPPNL